MTTILHIESSSHYEGSTTREIGEFLINQLQESHHESRIIERDLVKQPVPHITPQMVAALGQPDSQELVLSNQLIDELFSADIVVIEAPMYNFSIPSVLKAWIDHVTRAGRTFTYAGGAPKGLVTGKKAILILGRGGVYSEGPAKVMDYQEPYLRTILDFIGITDVQTIYIEGLGMGPEKVAEALHLARQTIATIIAKAA